MEDNDEKDLREDFLSQKDFPEKSSPSLNHDEPAKSIFNPSKDCDLDRDIESYDLSQTGHLDSEARLPVPELNHLNALANLDPSSKFSDNGSLRDMKLTANAPVEDETSKVFMCHLCDFKTAYANSLMNHQAVHSDIRPWACAMCEYAAKRKQDLKKHLHTVHGMMVESPMLKPILPSSAGGVPKFSAMTDGLKDQFVEGLNLKRSAEHEFPFYPPSSPAHQVFNAKRIKEEMPSTDATSPLGRDRKLPNLSETDDSPDDNLPVCFPPSLSTANESSCSRESPLFPEALSHMSSNRENGELTMPFGSPLHWQMKRREKLADSIGREWAQCSKSRECISFSTGPFREKTVVDSGNFKQLSCSRTKDDSFSHSLSEEDCGPEEIQNHSGSVESIKPTEPDRSISSSSTVSHVRYTQTQSGFMCEHCDILFFQRAMYLMHKGLHSAHNPWACTVCGQCFSEKYSFTSHFINQH